MRERRHEARLHAPAAGDLRHDADRTRTLRRPWAPAWHERGERGHWTTLSVESGVRPPSAMLSRGRARDAVRPRRSRGWAPPGPGHGPSVGEADALVNVCGDGVATSAEPGEPGLERALWEAGVDELPPDRVERKERLDDVEQDPFHAPRHARTIRRSLP